MFSLPSQLEIFYRLSLDTTLIGQSNPPCVGFSLNTAPARLPRSGRGFNRGRGWERGMKEPKFDELTLQQQLWWLEGEARVAVFGIPTGDLWA